MRYESFREINKLLGHYVYFFTSYIYYEQPVKNTYIITFYIIKIVSTTYI